MPHSTVEADSRRTAQALRLNQFMVEVSAEAMFTVAPDGRILNANETACERLEFTREELTGMQVADIDPHYPVDAWPSHFEELRQNRKMSFETQHRSKSGRIIDVEVSVCYFEFDGEEYCCSSVRDITERKQAEHILQLQQQVLAKVAATRGLLSETLDSLCHLVEELVPGCLATVMLIDASDGCLRFSAGPKLNDEITCAFEPLRPAIDAGSCGAAAHLKRPVIVTDTRLSPHWEKLHHIIEKFNLLACWSLPILDENDQALGTFAISHQEVKAPNDFHRQILETSSHMASIAIRRQRFEQQLRLAHHKLANVSRLSAIGEMASGIAHELNQPLTAIVNQAFVLEQAANATSADLDSMREVAAEIRTQGLRAGDIINGVRTLVRKAAPSCARVDANDIVHQSLALLEAELQHHSIVVCENLCDPIPAVHADGVQLQQVLVNLVRNAIDAMADVERGDRRLSLVTSVEEPNELVIQVRDTGHGLPGGEADTVFDAFRTTKREGMGMGLAISRSIAEAHGGRLTAGHADGGGAVFRMFLPLAQDAA